MSCSWPRTMPALITAFDADEHIDADAHEQNLAAAVATGAVRSEEHTSELQSH